jgi:hypothetical protein
MKRAWLAVLTACACFHASDDPVLSTDTGSSGGPSTGADDDPSVSSDPSATSPTSMTSPDDDGTSAATDDEDGDELTTLDESSTAADSSTGEPPEVVLFDLYEERCNVTWLASPDSGSAAEEIPCDGVDSFMGSIAGLRAAVLDGGGAAELVLRMVPWGAEEGTIGATYDGINLIDAVAPVFRTQLACPADSPSCAVRYQVLVRMAGAMGLPDIVEEGTEIPDGAPIDIEIDLIDYAGGAAQVTIVIINDGMSTQEDIILWAHPRIVEG